MIDLLIEYDDQKQEFFLQFSGISVVFNDVRIDTECNTIELMFGKVCVVTFHRWSALYSTSLVDALCKAKGSEVITEVVI